MVKNKIISSTLAAVLAISSAAPLAVFAEGTTFAMGDVDMDGIITGHDTAMVSRYLVEGDITLTEEQLKLADVDGDGEVTQADADKLYNEMQEYELHDINMDGRVLPDDGTVLFNILALQRIDPEIDLGGKEIRADVDCNGVVDVYDAETTLYCYGRVAAMLPRFEDGKYYYIMTAEEEQQQLQMYQDIYPKIKTFQDLYEAQIKGNWKDYMDINGDSELTVSDATRVLQMYAENAAGVKLVKAADGENVTDKADVNMDGKIDTKDATLILKAYSMNAAGLL